MWMFIPYIIVQVILWFLSQGNFSVLAKSSDIFVILTTVRGFVNLNDADSFFRQLEDYLFSDLYQRFRRRFIRGLDSIFMRLLEISILVIISIIFQSL